MIKSMTGYGKCVVQEENTKVTIEIRTLNSKQLDVNLRIPHVFKEKEIEMRRNIGTVLQRGKIDTSITIERNTVESSTEIDHKIAKHYYSELKLLAKELDQESFTDFFPIIVKMPEVFVNKETEVDKEELELVINALKNALAAVNTFRIEEGKVLEQDLNTRVSNILNLLTEVEKHEKPRIANIKQRIEGNINKLLQESMTDKNRLEQEMIYYIEKLDITEEKVRLKNNCDYFIVNLNNSESSGKKLGFITQEIGREINTLGSKANDSNLQKIVVLMKDELEKIKEQLFNIL